LALSEVRLGIMPGGGGTQNLPRAVGERRAKELILTARAFTPEEGADWGLVNRVCEPPSLLDEAGAPAPANARNGPPGVRPGKKTHPPRPHGARLRGFPLGEGGQNPPGGHRRPPGRREGLQRKAQADVQGKMITGK